MLCEDQQLFVLVHRSAVASRPKWQVIALVQSDVLVLVAVSDFLKLLRHFFPDVHVTD